MDLASHPLVSTMHRLTEINQFFNLPVRELEGDGWIEATELFLGDDQRLRNLVMTYGQKAWGTTNNHVAGSVFIIAYLTRLVWPVIGQYVLQRRVPKVALDNVSFHCNSDGIDATALNHPWFAVLPGDPAADHPDSECVGGTDCWRCHRPGNHPREDVPLFRQRGALRSLESSLSTIPLQYDHRLAKYIQTQHRRDDQLAYCRRIKL